MYNQLPQSPSLYVGDLAEDVTEQILHGVFTSIGNVASIRVCRDHATRQSLGYAYVNFHNADDADRAIQTLNFSDINGKQCRIMWSQRDPALRKSGLGNIFIKNLDPNVDNKRLMDLFSVFGNILSCKVSTDIEGRSKGYGYVHFDSTEAAKKAIERYDGQILSNQQLSVTLFQRREDREKQLEWTNVYIKNIPSECDENHLAKLFSQFGATTSVKISRDLKPNMHNEASHRGFGFVNFETHEGAKKAVDQFSNPAYVISPGMVLYVTRFKSKQERHREKEKDIALRRLQRYNGVHLYVKNLENSINEESLTVLFSKYGNVKSARIMRDGNGYSRGFGFVSFASVEEARNAIADLNNCTVWGKPIQVCLALPRAQRRAQSQATQHLFAHPGVPYPATSMFGVPMYMQPGQQIAAGPRPFSVMPTRPSSLPAGAVTGAGPASQSRAAIPIRGYPIPSYQMNHFNAIPHPHPQSTNQFSYPSHNPQFQQHSPSQYQQQQQMQRKNKNNKSVIHQRGQIQPQNQSNLNEPNQAQHNVIVHPNEPLTALYLTSMNEDQRKAIIGERLYPKIAQSCPDFAPKVTGMLLEMENTELLNLLESDDLLQLKVKEALVVLESYTQSH